MGFGALRPRYRLAWDPRRYNVKVRAFTAAEVAAIAEAADAATALLVRTGPAPGYASVSLPASSGSSWTSRKALLLSCDSSLTRVVGAQGRT